MPAANVLSLFVAYQFIRLISKPFSEWEMHRAGLIDDEGNKLRNPKTANEKKYFNSWFNMVRNVKKALQTVPGGKSKFASYATAFALLRDSKAPGMNPEVLQESIKEWAENFEVEWPMENAVSKGSGKLLPGSYLVVGGPHEEEMEGEPLKINQEIQAEAVFFRTPVFRVIDKGITRFFAESDLCRSDVLEDTVAADVAAPVTMRPRGKRPKLQRRRYPSEA